MRTRFRFRLGVYGRDVGVQRCLVFLGTVQYFGKSRMRWGKLGFFLVFAGRWVGWLSRQVIFFRMVLCVVIVILRWNVQMVRVAGVFCCKLFLSIVILSDIRFFFIFEGREFGLVQRGEFGLGCFLRLQLDCYWELKRWSELENGFSGGGVIGDYVGVWLLYLLSWREGLGFFF